MPRFFNTTGPCDPARHYMLPPAERLVRAQLERYINGQLYWVLHAPRQTGKTTFLQSWMREINAGTEAISCYVSIEACQGESDPEKAMQTIAQAVFAFAEAELGTALAPKVTNVPPLFLLHETLRHWADLVAPKPLVVLFDEVDVLQDQSLISFLRQCRSGFSMRGIGKFPVSIALVGMRDLRDYLVRSKEGVALNPGSPFNIKEDSASLSSFSQTDVTNLLSQHTVETGQLFEPEAIKLLYELTRGQPWLVNALAKKCVWTLVKQETGAPVTAAHIREAKELLIQERAVHLDSLAERLRDPRVKRVVEAILVSKSDATIGRADRDVEFCMDLGLVVYENGLRIANPIYQEIIPRLLSLNFQDNVPSPESRWQREDGTLDMPALLREFQKFWQRHSEIWERDTDYTEAFPHLLLMAFFQRITNGGGRIEREYAAGRGRVDLAIEFGGAWSIVEVKLVHPQDGLETTIQEGLVQAAAYRDRVDPNAEAYLVVFDRRLATRKKTWKTRLKTETRPGPDGKPITVLCA